MDFDFGILWAVGLFGDARHAGVVEVTPCVDCRPWGDRRHVRAEVVRANPDTLDFFESYVSGACGRRAVAA